jgi:RND family efflux transporter MFP subunit
MKKILILLIALVYLTMMSCKNNTEHLHDDHNHDHEMPANDDHEEHNDNHTHEHEETKSDAHEHESEEHNHDLESDEHGHDHETEEHDHKYKTGKVDFETFSYIIKSSGEIKAAVTDEIVLSATTSGIIHYADNQLTEGALLKSGQTIFYITGDDLIDNNVNVKYAKAKSSYAKAKSDYDRAEHLVQKKIISEKECEQLKMVYLDAKSEFDVLKKSANGMGDVNVKVQSFIKEFYVEEGQYVEVGEKLACVITNKKMRLLAEVSQKHLNELAKIESANFMQAEGSRVYDTKKLNGKLLSYGKALMAGSHYLPVVFEIDYDESLIPGSFVKVFLKSKSKEKSIIVPKTALIEEQGNYFVFVEEGHDSFHKHQVKLGSEDGIRIVIKEGLSKDDIIVTEGAYFVKLASMSNTLPAHNHAH